MKAMYSKILTTASFCTQPPVNIGSEWVLTMLMLQSKEMKQTCEQVWSPIAQQVCGLSHIQVPILPAGPQEVLGVSLEKISVRYEGPQGTEHYFHSSDGHVQIMCTVFGWGLEAH